MHSVEELEIKFDVTETCRKYELTRKVDPNLKTLVLSINLSRVKINLLQTPYIVGFLGLQTDIQEYT